MSAIAGCLSDKPDFPAGPLCARLLKRQSVYGPDHCARSADGPFAAGRCLRRTLPEDSADRQPLEDESGRFLLVADLRIDNREELGGALGLSAATASELADSEILLRGWLAWGRDLVGRMIGDFAFAVWDRREATLFLARDTGGERPLHYRRGPGWFAFASLPWPLADLAGGSGEPDEAKLAAFVADLPAEGPATFFRDVSRLEPGHCALLRGESLRIERYWRPRPAILRLAGAREYGEALREQIDRAVAPRLRRSGGIVAAQLSAGFDSSAVATSAALILAARGERLLALTSAPREGFDGAVPAGRMADESAIAAATAALHPNVDHEVVRPGGSDALALIGASQLLSGQPVGHVCNNLWWQALNRRAAEAGASVMLTGEAGNLTLSAGAGLETLAELVRAGAWGRWRREAAALVSRGRFGWRTILDASFGPWIPTRLYAAVRSRTPAAPALVAPAWRTSLHRRLKSAAWGLRPSADDRVRRWSLLKSVDPGNFRKRALAQWGVEERDPTTDRRLVEFSLSLPVDAFLSEGEQRPALRLALVGRVAEAVTERRLRGYQMADWYEQIGPRDVAAYAEDLAARGNVRTVDLDSAAAAAARWPTEGFHRLPVIYDYRMNLLRALAAARFESQVREGAFA